MIDNILKLLTPKDKVAYLNRNISVRQGLEKFRVHGFNAVPVLNEDGTYFGTITEGDFLWKIIDDDIVDVEELEDISIEEIIRKEVKSCKVDVSLNELKELIVNNNFVPIVDDRNIFMGIITRKTLINSLIK